MSDISHEPLSQFSRNHRQARVATSTRVIAAVLTGVLYGFFALLIWQGQFLLAPASPATAEIVANLLPLMAHKKILPRPAPFLVRLIRPRAESPAPPTLTIASNAPVAPSLLAASAAKSSPLTGGVAAGTGATGQMASANGTNGNGSTFAACLDPVWMHAVDERVRKFFYYPAVARSNGITGVVMVHFIVRRDGRLDMLEISKSSGDDALDEAAYNMMRKAQPLPPIPARMHTDRINGLLPVDFGVPDVNIKATIGNCSG